jgi:hypothetical protein
MISRLLGKQIDAQLSRYPAVALLGTRQTGKTTLAKEFQGRYFDLENPQDRLRLEITWEELTGTQELVILDEIQAMPEMFPRLRAAIDSDRKRYGRFLILGSVSPALMQEAGQALTGRLALCELTGFLARELPAEEWDILWKRGGYPDGGVLDPSRFADWQQNYLALMAQRDLPSWGLSAQPALIQRLFRMLAALHGQMWNASQIGKSLGLSYHTANSYADFLEQAFLIRRLPAYAANLRKRLVKSPKFYWRDSGLLHALLDLTGERDLFDQPWAGMSWEGWVIEQILGHLQSAGHSFQAFYVRTSDQREIDLVLDYRGQLWAFEIKLSSAPDVADLRRLQDNAALIGADRVALISRTAEPIRGEAVASLNLAAVLDWLLG